MLQFGYYERAPFQIATEAQRRQALFLIIMPKIIFVYNQDPQKALRGYEFY